MAEEKETLFNLSEAAQFLGITEENLRRLAEEGEVPAYKIGGVFLRFKADQLTTIKPHIKEKLDNLSRNPKKTKVTLEQEKNTFLEKLAEFWHFYDFYIIALLIIAFILYVIFKFGV